MANIISPAIPQNPPTSCPLCSFTHAFPYLTVDGIPLWGCYRCGCLFAHHPRLERILGEYYAGQYADDRGHGGERGIDRCKEGTYTRYLSRIATRKGSRPRRLLEIGCSAGLGLLTAKKLGFEVAGLELSPDSVRTARELLPGVEIFSGTVLEAPYPDNSFDVVVLLDTVEHFQKPHAELEACARLLAPGGDMVIVTPNTVSLTHRLSPHLWPHLVIEHSTLFNPKALRRTLEEFGLRQVHTGFAHKKFNLEMMTHHLNLNPGTPGAGLLLKLFSLMPAKLRQAPFPFNYGEFFAYFKKPSPA